MSTSSLVPAPLTIAASGPTSPEEDPAIQRKRRKELNQHRTLILNSDHEPMGFPLETMNYQDIIKGLVLNRLDVVEWSNVWVHGPNLSMRLPSIAIIKDFIPERALTRVPVCNLYNLYIRDLGICQYTGAPLSMKENVDLSRAATLDHLLPQYRGGKTEWANAVLSSSSANGEKANLLLWQTSFKLDHLPWVPTHHDLLYLWLTKYQVVEAESPWMEFLRLVKPSDNAQRALEKYAKAA